MMPDHGPLLYEGKAKRIFVGPDPDTVLVEFKNDTTAFNAKKKIHLHNKGLLNCQISARLFEALECTGIPTHFLGLASDTWMVVQRVDIIPLEVVLRNVAAGSICYQMPISLGTILTPALLDFYLKDDCLGDPLLTEARLIVLGLVDSERRVAMEKLARQVNKCLVPLFAEQDLTLVDFKLELGLNAAGTLLVADEISPDTCRLWDRQQDNVHDRILDKDRFRYDLGGVIEAYGEILKRVQQVCSKPRNYR